jgi:hypothetical protein
MPVHHFYTARDVELRRRFTRHRILVLSFNTMTIKNRRHYLVPFPALVNVLANSRSIQLLFVGLLAAWLAACGPGSARFTGGGPPPPPGGTITQPTALNLYPNQSPSQSALLTVMVTSVGSVSVSMPLGFDTGSAGVTLYAESIFPSNLVSSSGFVFSAGQTSLTYNGITVTNLQGTRSYGTLNQTVEYGNLGFAELTIGDAQGTLTTEVMPVFLFYSLQDVTGHPYSPPGWQGWFGVASTDGTIDVAGAVEPPGGFAACSQQSNTSCYVVSAIKYFDYGSQVNGGFILSPATIQTCDITTAGSCTPAPMLTVGLDAGVESGFSTTPLVCPPNGYVGPPVIAGYPVCQKNIPNVTIAASGGSFTGDAFFDTGTPYIYLSTPPGSSFPSTVPAGTTVTVTPPSGFNYSYTAAGTGTAYTVVDAGGNGNSIIGVQYFTTNSFLLDFTSSIEGWK